jgi:non-homologous end joining protein Ku
MARSVRALAKQRWDPSALSDPHEAVRQLAERKYEKKQDVIRSRAAARDEGGDVVDLMQMLRESLAQNDLAAKNGRRTRRAKPAVREKSAARKKRAGRAKKTAARRR